MSGTLYYGDNLDVLRSKVRPESVDLCYIDPPFNSKRNYNQIYNNVGSEDRAQAQAFIDTWTWDEFAISGYDEILQNKGGRFQRQTIELIKGLHNVLGRGSLLAYLVSMTLRIVEIHRVLKETGSFYLHCDPTSSHYLKLITDGIFVSGGGEFQNEVIWNYQTGGASKRHYARKHDVLLFYTKSDRYVFNSHAVREPRTEKSMKRAQNPKGARISSTDTTKLPTDVFQIAALNPMSTERLGYPTQKPEELLERVILASSNEGDVILDAYCGCGTTVAVAHRLNRKWIGVDITFQSIALVLRRLEDLAGKDAAKQVKLDGVPRDLASATALAHKSDDRVRKEFEKWAVLTYTNHRGIINDRKGADNGIDGTVYFMTGPGENASMVFQVKSGHVGRGDIAQLRGDMERAGAALATLITLEKPTAPMIAQAKSVGHYKHELMARSYDIIRIVTVAQIIEEGKRLEIPLSLEMHKPARRSSRPPEKVLPPGLDSKPANSQYVEEPKPVRKSGAQSERAALAARGLTGETESETPPSRGAAGRGSKRRS